MSNMKPVNLRRHNLNALPVLRDILRHGNLTRASAALGLTQPALSNILKQLRLDFEDPLVVRSGKGMQLTPKALALLAPLEESLSAIEKLLAQENFDPSSANNRFRIATTDHCITMLAPSLFDIMMKEAPSVRMQMIVAQTTSVQALMVGDLDMVITPKILMTAGIADTNALESVNTELLMSERLVCLAHKDDKAFSAGLTLDEYLARPHAGYLFGDKLLASIEQVYLSRLGLKQNDLMLVSTYAALPGTVAATGGLAIVPESMARSACLLFPLQYAPPPFPTEPIDWTMVWHLRNERDPAMLWLRNSLKRSVNDLDTAIDLEESKQSLSRAA
jgi:LysR family transcriptional regulator, nod-box dependent transcriptional activator